MDLKASRERETEDHEPQVHDEADLTRELEIKALEDAAAFLGGPRTSRNLTRRADA